MFKMYDWILNDAFVPNLYYWLRHWTNLNFGQCPSVWRSHEQECNRTVFWLTVYNYLSGFCDTVCKPVARCLYAWQDGKVVAATVAATAPLQHVTATDLLTFGQIRPELFY